MNYRTKNGKAIRSVILTKAGIGFERGDSSNSGCDYHGYIACVVTDSVILDYYIVTQFNLDIEHFDRFELNDVEREAFERWEAGGKRYFEMLVDTAKEIILEFVRKQGWNFDDELDIGFNLEVPSEGLWDEKGELVIGRYICSPFPIPEGEEVVKRGVMDQVKEFHLNYYPLEG